MHPMIVLNITIREQHGMCVCVRARTRMNLIIMISFCFFFQFCLAISLLMLLAEALSRLRVIAFVYCMATAVRVSHFHHSNCVCPILPLYVARRPRAPPDSVSLLHISLWLLLWFSVWFVANLVKIRSWYFCENRHRTACICGGLQWQWQCSMHNASRMYCVWWRRVAQSMECARILGSLQRPRLFFHD